jgi:hypothetical protein
MNQATDSNDKAIFGLQYLTEKLGVGKGALRKALVNVTPAGTIPGGHKAYTLEQAKSALEAQGSRAVGGPLKDQKLAEQVRQLKIANDAREGVLIRRDSVVSAFARIASRLASIRTTSESQDPPRIVGKDLHEVRAEIRKIWDAVGASLASCSEEFKESKHARTNDGAGLGSDRSGSERPKRGRPKKQREGSVYAGGPDAGHADGSHAAGQVDNPVR